jgi:nucleotide-binding universal stress UspA family protein
MLKSIFFPVTDGELATTALDCACELARRHGAQLIAGVCVNAISPHEVAPNYYPFQVYEAFGAAARDLEERLRQQLEDALATAEVSYRVHVASSFVMNPAELATVHARYCDLVVFGRIAGATRVRERGDFATLLFHTGRPVLVAPPVKPREGFDAPALVAWKPSREASRAVHDALPLLQQASSVRVLSVQPASGEFEHGQLVGADIGAALAQHGLRVETAQCATDPGGVGATLLRDAREQGCGLLVAGGYGHRRWREYVFGGATFDLFEDATLPVLYSH